MNLTDFLAVYAAIVSTGMFGWSIYQSRANYKVEVTHSLYDVSETPKAGIAIKALNNSQKPVYLQSFLLVAGDEKSVVLESLVGIKRAGADAILTYFAEDVANWLK